MVKKLMLVVDNGPLRPRRVDQVDLLEAYIKFCLALWGIQG